MPNELLQKIYNRTKAGSEFLDLGCGQGRDTLFMLEKGFKITAIDNSCTGIEKIKELIQTNNLPINNINLFCDDIKNLNISKNKYDIINAFNSLQFLPKKIVMKIIDDIKKNIKDGGYVIISSFTINDPLFKKNGNDERCFFEPKELKKKFSDFHILLYEEKNIKDKGHLGSPKPHRHGVVKLIAQKQ